MMPGTIPDDRECVHLAGRGSRYVPEEQDKEEWILASYGRNDGGYATAV